MKSAVVPKMTALTERFKVFRSIVGGIVVQMRHRQDDTTIFDRAVLEARKIELIVTHTTLFAGVMGATKYARSHTLPRFATIKMAVLRFYGHGGIVLSI